MAVENLELLSAPPGSAMALPHIATVRDGTIRSNCVPPHPAPPRRAHSHLILFVGVITEIQLTLLYSAELNFAARTDQEAGGWPYLSRV